MRVLLIEDHPAMRVLVEDHLRRGGWSVESVGCGEDALVAVAAIDYDAVVLDLELPDMDGTEVLRRMRTASRPCAPVMILSARDDVRDRVLDAGAVDYMVKPFDLAEFEARLRAIVRRPSEWLDAAVEAIRGLVWSGTTECRRLGGADIDLTRPETSLLEALVSAGGRPVVRDLLEDRLRDCDDQPATRGLETAVSGLRRKLILVGSCLRVEALPGIGYRVRGE